MTFNSANQQYIALYNGNGYFNVFDNDLIFSKQIRNGGNGNDHEDLTFIGVTASGLHEYAIVDEYGRMFLGSIAADADLNYKNFQRITYASTPKLSNTGGEGVAYNKALDTFYICIEGRYHSDPNKASPMKVYQFKRPASSADISYLDSGLSVTELFNAESKLRPYISDISSCYFNNQSQNLLILSHVSEKIIEVNLNGDVQTSLDINEGGRQFEGMTFNADFSQLLIVSEPKNYVLFQRKSNATLVNLSVEESAGVARANANIRSGIPLPKGLLSPSTPVSLFVGDTPLPTQSKTLSLWDDGSIRWLLMDTTLPIDAAENKQLSLRRASSSATTPSAITLQQSSSHIIVDTGRLKVEIPKNYGGIIDRAWVDGTLLIDTPTDPKDRGPYIRTGGQQYFASLLQSSSQAKANDKINQYAQQVSNYNLYHPWNLDVAIEEQGDLHSIIRISGTHLNSNGDSFSTFIVRLHFYAGKENIKVDHTLVYTGDETQTIEGYGLRLPFIGTQTLVEGQIGNNVELQQFAYDQFKVNQSVSAGQAIGYISRSNNQGSISIILRDMAERFPKALLSNTQGLEVQLYPDNIRAWDLSRDAPDPSRSEFSSFPLNEIATYDGETTRFTDHLYLRGAQGLSATDNYEIIFSTQASDLNTLAQQAKAVDQGPLLLLASPEWYSASKVMGVGAFSFSTDAQQAEGHFRIDRVLKTMADFMRINQRKQFNWFGQENYGDIRGRFIGGKNELYWLERGRYGWSGNSGEPSNQLWVQFLRKTSQQVFLDAEALARHTMDQQMVHYADAVQSDKQALDGRNMINSVGSLHRHGAQAWSGYANSPDYSHIAGIETYYYLTGDPRAKETLYEAGQFILRLSDNKTSLKNGLDVLDRMLAVFYDDTALAQAINTRIDAYRNYLNSSQYSWNRVEARLIDMNNNGQHDRDGDGRSNRSLYRSGFEFFMRAAPGLLYRYERTGDQVIGQLILDAADILVAGDGDDWDLGTDGHASSYFYQINLLAFAAANAQALNRDGSLYYALTKRIIENQTRAGNDFNDTAQISLASMLAIPDDWNDWTWQWQEDPLASTNPGILWLDRIITYQNDTIQDYHSYRAFIHLATAAALIPAGEMNTTP